MENSEGNECWIEKGCEGCMFCVQWRHVVGGCERIIRRKLEYMRIYGWFICVDASIVCMSIVLARK